MNSDARRDDRLHLKADSSETSDTIAAGEQPGYEMQNMSTFLRDDSKGPLLVAQNASFGWTRTGRPDVSDFSFTLSRGQFVFVIGPVGKISLPSQK